MEPDRRCAKCGQAIPWGEPECPLCSERFGYFWSQRRDTFLIVVFALMILLFVITGYTVRRYHAVERGLAQDWYRRGEQALKASHAGAALADFRNTLAYSRDNPLFQLRLTQAPWMSTVVRVPPSDAPVLSIYSSTLIIFRLWISRAWEEMPSTRRIRYHGGS